MPATPPDRPSSRLDDLQHDLRTAAADLRRAANQLRVLAFDAGDVASHVLDLAACMDDTAAGVAAGFPSDG